LLAFLAQPHRVINPVRIVAQRAFSNSRHDFQIVAAPPWQARQPLSSERQLKGSTTSARARDLGNQKPIIAGG
jgi:hypothetical protein